MLDAGLELESERNQIVSALAATSPSNWTPTQLAALKGNMDVTARGVPLKLLFGSDYPYRETEQHAPWRGVGVGIRPSLALGGLSTVWGGAMLPYRDTDLERWPIKSAVLEMYYRAVLELTGLSARQDDLADLFPLHCDAPQSLEPSNQARLFLKHLERHRDKLRAVGWNFGRSRLAVRVAPTAGDKGCVYCRLCMYGCPYGYIYNSADTVRQMRSEKNFTYQAYFIVTTLEERGDKVIINGYDRRTRNTLAIEAGRVYLAAGVISTAQILLRSRSDYDRPLRLWDSHYFLFPLVLARRTQLVQREALYTLSQLFIEIFNPQISRRAVHLQIYTYNDLVGQAVRKAFGPFARALTPLARQLEERMLMVQGYLHSDESPGIEMTLQRDGNSGRDWLQLSAVPNPETPRVVKRILREMLRQSRRLGGIVVPPLLQLSEPGRGFHSGGSFPMQERPESFESDCLGRPCGWTRVHAVDATVFPSVPATTITYTVMANAYRIGWETAALN